MAGRGRPFILDTNCFVDASASDQAARAYEEFCAWAAPRLYLSTVVAAELRAAVTEEAKRRDLERRVVSPYRRRGRIVNPSPAAWEALGNTLATLGRNQGLVLRQVRRSFIFDILVAWSSREIGAVLISRNEQDLVRIATVFRFDYMAPYPRPGRI